MSIGKMIHDRRVALGLTLEEVGEYCGVGKATVQRWETGAIRNMRRDKLALLSNILHLDPADMISDKAETVENVDMDRLEAMHQNPRLGLLFDRQRNMSEADIEFMLQFADRIMKERDND